MKSISQKFQISDIATVINAGIEDSPYLNGIIKTIRETRAYNPVADSTYIAIPALPDNSKNSGSSMSIPITGMLFVYKLLCWMGNGDSWDAQDARDAWSDFGAKHNLRAVDTLEASGPNIDSNFRFRHYDPEGGEPVPKNLQLYFGYSLEDWNRALVLMAFVHIQGLRPWEQLADKRDVGVYSLPYDDEDTATEAAAAQKEKVAHEQDRLQNMFQAYKDLGALENNEDATERHFATFVNDVMKSSTLGGKAKAGGFSYDQGMKELTGVLETVTSYMALSSSRDYTGNMNNPSAYVPVDLDAIAAN